MASQSSKEKQQKENTLEPAPKPDDWSLKAGDIVMVDEYEVGLVAKSTPKYYTFAQIYHLGQIHMIHIHRITKL